MLEHISLISEIAASLAVIASLLFVGWQIRQNTSALERSEANATQQQFQAIRLLVAGDKDVARLWVALEQGTPTDPVDQTRLVAFVSEIVWCIYHVWDRSRHGFIPRDEFGRAASTYVIRILRTPFGSAWWAASKAGYPGPFVAEVDKLLEAA
jgi:hypothetical protein